MKIRTNSKNNLKFLKEIWKNETLPEEWKKYIRCPLNEKADNLWGNYMESTSVVFVQIHHYWSDFHTAAYIRKRSRTDMRQILNKFFGQNMEIKEDAYLN